MGSRPPTRIFLVRHGTAEGADGLVVGQIDLPLSAVGATSLEQLAASWDGPPPDRLVASGLERSTASARTLDATWGSGLEIETDERLQEMDFGAWDGLTWKELARREGERLEAWKSRWWEASAPDGESFPQVAERARAWLEETAARDAGRTVVAVGHGGSIRTILGHVLGMPLDHTFHLHLDHGRVSGLVSGRRGIEVAFVNNERFPAPPAGVAPGSPSV